MSVIKKIGFFVAFIFPPLVIAGFYLGGWWNYLTTMLSFVLIPLFDYLIGTTTTNIPADKVKQVSNDSFYKFVLFVWTWVQLAFMFWAFFAVTSGKLQHTYEWVGFILGTGLVTGGIGITVAHELGHKKEALERFYSKVLLLTVSYMHFYIEHNRGHHVTVATPEDPATSRKNEIFYVFWLRSVVNGYLHAWKIENNRLRKSNKSPLSLGNNMIWYTLLPILFCGVAMAGFSYYTGHIAWEIPVFFFAQSISAFTLLELVNYIEHYGIVRRQLEDGRYERVTPLHSWNASHVVSNFFLFQLQRHSDHHANAIKRYQVLNHYDVSPQLPAGYSTMIIIAMFPPLWFALMNKRLEKWQGDQMVAQAQ